MSEARTQFPPNVVLYVRGEIRRRQEYKAQLEQTPEFLGNDRFKKLRNQETRNNLATNISKITQDVLAIVRAHCLSIQVDSNDEVTISNILAALPPPDEVIIKKVFQGDG